MEAVQHLTQYTTLPPQKRYTDLIERNTLEPVPCCWLKETHDRKSLAVLNMVHNQLQESTIWLQSDFITDIQVSWCVITVTWWSAQKTHRKHFSIRQECENGRANAYLICWLVVDCLQLPRALMIMTALGTVCHWVFWFSDSLTQHPLHRDQYSSVNSAWQDVGNNWPVM